MTQKEIKKYIKENRDQLPLSYEQVIFREKNNSTSLTKMTRSSKYKDENYTIAPFFKNITRF